MGVWQKWATTLELPQRFCLPLKRPNNEVLVYLFSRPRILARSAPLQQNPSRKSRERERESDGSGVSIFSTESRSICNRSRLRGERPTWRFGPFTKRPRRRGGRSCVANQWGDLLSSRPQGVTVCNSNRKTSWLRTREPSTPSQAAGSLDGVGGEGDPLCRTVTHPKRPLSQTKDATN